MNKVYSQLKLLNYNVLYDDVMVRFTGGVVHHDEYSHTEMEGAELILTANNHEELEGLREILDFWQENQSDIIVIVSEDSTMMYDHDETCGFSVDNAEEVHEG